MDLILRDEKRVTVDISGMGGSYEQGCQRMLYIGLQYLDEWPLSIWEGTSGLKGVYGLLITESPELKALESKWGSDPELDKYGMTGAMHQCVMGHLNYIHKQGYHSWLEHFSEERKYLIQDPPVIGC